MVYFYFTARLIPEPFSWSLQQLSQSGFEWVPLHQDDPRDCTLQFHPPHSNDKQKVKGNVNNTSLKITIIFPNQLGSINLWWLCLDIAEINLKWCFINPCLQTIFFRNSTRFNNQVTVLPINKPETLAGEYLTGVCPLYSVCPFIYISLIIYMY